MRVPEEIFVQLSSPTRAALDSIIVQLEVHAGRKNPYFILCPKTDESGHAVLTRHDLIGQFADHWEMALMDYNGTLEQAGPVVEASLFDPTWSLQNRSLALAWPLLKHEQTKWSSREQEYEYRVTCRNPYFSAKPVAVNLELTQSVELEVIPRSTEKGAG